MKIKYQKKVYRLCLGGSTISGKTTYINTYMNKSFHKLTISTLGLDKFNIQAPNKINKKIIIFDTPRWERKFDTGIQKQLLKTDGVLLLFDLSNKEDFDRLSDCLNMITDYYELEDFPVLLIGNKADLGKAVTDEEIKQFQEKEHLIKYFEVSCQNLSNVDESLNFIINYLYDKEKNLPNLN